MMRHPTEAQLKELIEYATLAASSHNTQCWQFQIKENAIAILPDLSRRCPVVDPDNHHLYVSLGCATENLVQAADAFGLSGQVTFDDTGAGTINIELEPAAVKTSPLFEAIPVRQCTRSEYDGQPLREYELRKLESAGTGNGVRVVMLTEPEEIETIIKYVVQGNTAQMTNSVFLQELKSWIRFSDREAAKKGDGLSGKTSGKPSIPRWLGEPLFPLLLQVPAENEKYARHIRSSAGVAVFVSEVNDRTHWIEVGRCYERFALQATALGIRNAFINQPVEESDLRSRLTQALGLGQVRPDLLVRFGRAQPMPSSLRRPIEAVLV
ncbi:hypothetical protein S7335_79 [Synechococcus sp. PCC 7335]|uniref:Acg family FMN-binding oxidoreductase n=1 Tax=Synechococcus sp. (strain ATCC 29403 / PCC 7335) TaxID=91464 RepID=UPI00017ED9E1|nr:hypothetical protein [Synechococcus sp. PCC 7335]EDX82901.1 hypothetical protein S7335_79 [Synechococcus sp. PCC 7335]